MSSGSSWAADFPIYTRDSSIGGYGLRVIPDATLSTTGVLTVNEVIATTVTGNTGASDHGMLTGLGDDDHTQYVLDSEKSNLLGTANQISVASGTDAVLTTVTLSLPQNIHTAATPEFSTLLLTGNVLTLYDGADPSAVLTNSASGLLLEYNGGSSQNWTEVQTDIYVPAYLADGATVNSTAAKNIVLDTDADDEWMQLKSAGTVRWEIRDDGNVFEINRGANTNNVFAVSGGNVGIGDNLPDATLEVAGTLYVSATDAGDGDLLKVLSTGMTANAGTTNEVMTLVSSDQFAGVVLDDSGSGSFRLYGNGGGALAQYYTGSTYATAFNVAETTGLFTVKATDGLSAFNVEGGATIGSAAYVGNATYTAANGEVYLERNLLIGDVTSSGTALINMGVNRTSTLPLIALSNTGSGDAGILITNASNVWQWGSRNALTGDPFVIGGGSAPTVTDLIFITKTGEIGVRVAVPDAMLDVVAANTYANPVLELDQKDDDQNFISFLGNDDLTGPGLDPVSSGALPTAFGDFQTSIRVEVNGVAYRIPLY